MENRQSTWQAKTHRIIFCIQILYKHVSRGIMFREKQSKRNDITVKIWLTYQKIDLYFIVDIVICLVHAVMLGIFAFFVQLFLSAARHGRDLFRPLTRARDDSRHHQEAKKGLGSIL